MPSAQECLCPDCHLAAVCLCTKHLTSLSFQVFMGTQFTIWYPNSAPGVFWTSLRYYSEDAYS